MSNDQMRNEILSAGLDDGDWTDVLHRTKRARRRQGIYGFVLLTALVVVGVASAYALGYPIVDFSNAESAPEKVVADFASIDIGAPPGMATGVIPKEAKRIPGLYLNGKEWVLWVAPTKDGGFCMNWGCTDRHTLAGRIDVETTGNATAATESISGAFTESGGERIALSYADGSSDDIPFVWVTAPIDAGFYVFGVSPEHQSHARRPVEIRLLDGGGKVLTRSPITDIAREMERFRTVERKLLGYPRLSVPALAIWSERRQLFDLYADDGTHLGLWVAPSKDGGQCVWANQMMSCPPPNRENSRPAKELAVGTFGGGTHVGLEGDVGSDIAEIEARFQDGEVVKLEPRENYLLWAIPSEHYPLGHRLEELVGLDSSGNVVATQKLTPNAPALYPCDKPKDYGHDVHMCP